MHNPQRKCRFAQERAAHSGNTPSTSPSTLHVVLGITPAQYRFSLPRATCLLPGVARRGSLHRPVEHSVPLTASNGDLKAHDCRILMHLMGPGGHSVRSG